MEYYEIPTHYEVYFEGKVVIPTDNEDYAKMVVKQALENFIKQFDIYEDNKSPTYSIWIGNPYIKLVNKNGIEVISK